MRSRDDIRRIHLGYFVRSADEAPEGRPQLTVALAYLVRHPAGLLLFDTGIGVGDPEEEARYPSVRRPLPAALDQTGVTVDDITFVANCHLHIDHCGGNPLLAGRPIFTQRREYDVARSTPGYTAAELVDIKPATYELVEGRHEILPDIEVIPTPGHTDGHQSLVVHCDDGTILLAGQTHASASTFAADHLAWTLRRDTLGSNLPIYPDWMDLLAELDPTQVLFAHDTLVWERNV